MAALSLVVAVAVHAAGASRASDVVEIAPGVFQPIVSNGYLFCCCSLECHAKTVGNRTDDTVAAYGAWLSAGGKGIDTAFMYGNQPQIGRALAGASPQERRGLFITTKVHCTTTAAGALAMVRTNLEQLKVPRVDLVLVHGTGDVGPTAPGNPGCGWHTRCDPDGPYPGECSMPCCSTQDHLRATFQGLEMALRLNLTRAIGVSNWRVPHFEAVLPGATVAPAVNQMRTFVGYRDNATFAFCKQRGITWMAYSPLGPIGQHPKAVLNNSLVQAIAKRHSATAAQVGLAWVERLPATLATASNSAAYDAEDLGSTALAGELTQAEVAALDAYVSPDVPPQH